MKKTVLLPALLMLVSLSVLVSCGGDDGNRTTGIFTAETGSAEDDGFLDMEKVNDVWITEKIDGMTAEEYCRKNPEFDPDRIRIFLTASPQEAVLEINYSKLKFGVEPKRDGFECINKDDGSVFMSVKYDEVSDSISFRCTLAEGKTAEYTAVRLK